MKIVFLCGGIGKRMFPVTEDKFLISFLGSTLLEDQIKMALQSGINDFVMIGNPNNMQQIKEIADGIKGANFSYALQRHARGIADALKCADRLLDGEIIVANPNDVFTAGAYKNLLDEYHRGGAASYVLGYAVERYFPGGYLEVNEEGYLSGIIEKPVPGSEPSNMVNILLHLHTDPGMLMDYIGKVESVKDDVYECAMDDMIKAGHRIRAVRYTDEWQPIKYPWHLLDVVRHFLDRADHSIAESASISKKATIAGKVIISDNVRILENAVVRGPVYIGPNTVIGNSALVREYSHIGANCVVGFCTEIKSSFIGDNCWFHSSYVGDSVIGSDCSFGAGTVTANFRFDEKEVVIKYGKQMVLTGRNKLGAIMGDNCKTGINASILPGRRIGPNSIVGSHVCLSEDLPPDTTIRAQSGYVTSSNHIRLDQPGIQHLKGKLI